jgi:hypothetical protein
MTIICYLHQFGEMCTVAKRNKIKDKLSDRGFIAMMVGYAEDHTNDTYRLYNFKTNEFFLVVMLFGIINYFWGRYHQI